MKASRQTMTTSVCALLVAIVGATPVFADLFAGQVANGGQKRSNDELERRARERVLSLGSSNQLGSQLGESSYTYKGNTDGRMVVLEIRNGVVVRAEIDGRPVPDGQIEREGSAIRLKNEKGEVLFEHQVPSSTAGGVPELARMMLGLPGVPGVTGVIPGGARAISAPDEAEAPKVMIGVQMASPDGSLRGHLGLKDGAATMISAVHEGLPASKAGLSPYDIIVSVDGNERAGPNELRGALKDKKPGESIKLGVIQRGVRKDLVLTLEAYDRKKLDDAKVNAIADSQTWNGWNRGGGPGGPDGWEKFGEQFDQSWGGSNEQWKDLAKRIRESSAAGAGAGGISGADPFMAVIPGPNGEKQQMYLDAERFREMAEREYERAMKLRGTFSDEHRGQLDEMRRQMDEMQAMMRKMMMNQSPTPPANPGVPGRNPQPEQGVPIPREARG